MGIIRAATSIALETWMQRWRANIGLYRLVAQVSSGLLGVFLPWLLLYSDLGGEVEPSPRERFN